MNKRSTLVDAGVAFSLANLFFIISWKELIFPVTRHYFRPVKPSSLEHLAIFADVVILGSLIFLLLRGLERLPSRWKLLPQLVGFICGLLMFGPLSYEAMKWLSPQTARFVDFYIPVAVALGCLICAFWKGFTAERLFWNFTLAALFLLPFSFVLILEGVRQQSFKSPDDFAPQSLHAQVAEASPNLLKKRVVWIIFDELDSSLLRSAKSNGTEMREWDRISDQAFVAANAYSPNNRTQDSTSSLLTGKALIHTSIASERELLLLPADGSAPSAFGKENDIFQEVANRGGKSGIAGWYQPYCRVFKGRVSECTWSALATPDCRGISGFTACNLRYFLRAVEEVPQATRLFTTLRDVNFRNLGETFAVQSQRNDRLAEDAEKLLQNPNLNLVYLHFPIPHMPYIARPSRTAEDADYYSSLEVMDDTLGRIRRTLESAGQWDDTVVILSSDHVDRFKRKRDFDFLPETQQLAAVNDRHIPFIVKFPGQTTKIDYVPKFNTLISFQLILDIFDEKIKTADQVPAWLDTMRTTSPQVIDHETVGPTF